MLEPNVEAKHLFLVCKILGIKVLYDGHAQPNLGFFKAYSVCITFLINFLSAWSWMKRSKMVYGDTPYSITIMDSLETLLVILAHWVCVLFPLLKAETSAYEDLIWELETSVRLGSPNPFYKATATCLCLAMSVLVVVNVTLWSVQHGFHSEKYFIVKELQIYVCSVFIIQLYYFNMHLRRIFRRVNRNLSFIILNQVYFVGKRSENLTGRFSKLYDKLCDVIDLENSVYGYPLVFLLIFSAARVVGTINVTVLWTFTSVGVFINLLGTLTLLGIVALVVTSCELVAQERKSTVRKGFKVLLHLPVHGDEDKLVRESLTVMIREMARRKSSFTAAGFFELDYRTLIATLSSIVSYTVVVLNIM